MSGGKKRKNRIQSDSDCADADRADADCADVDRADADRALWAYVRQTVVPLQDRQISYSEFLDCLPPQDDTPGPVSDLKKQPKAKPVKSAAVITRDHAYQPKYLKHGESAGIDKRQADRLRKGRLSVEAKLDLHGLSQKEAHRVLDAFIERQWAVGRRCVLVVTGKGRGILQQAVPRWLNQSPVSWRILSYTYAQQRDGGTGALYILLKKNRLLR